MRDIKTYLSVAPVLSTLWFGALAGLLIEINRLFPDALSDPFFLILVIAMEGIDFFVILQNLILFNLFLVSEGKRKKRWIGLNLRVIKNLVNPIFENRNSI